MRQLLFSLVVISASSILIGQSMDDLMEVRREVLKTEKKAVVAEAMQFTDAKSAVFWPLHSE